MNLNEIKQLIKIVESANVSHVSLESDGMKVEIKKEFLAPALMGQTYLPQVQTYTIPHPPQSPQPTQSTEAPKTEAEPAVDPKLVAIKSQMVGTYYDAPSPDTTAYVQVGSRIKAGDVVCVIEAMKLFNEIESEFSGTIEKMLLDNAAQVEYGQDLFLVRID